MLEKQEHKQVTNNKRIAKNTILLYFRMLFTMGVTLYTSRVVLSTLGVEDYGIYNVTGGVVAMFAFLNTAMSSASQRYITFALGKGDVERLRTVFNTSLQVHIVISVFLIILSETLGLWFLTHKLVIPENRMFAAMWVYQCSIATAVLGVMSVPYNADIVANEKMSAFAYISVLDVSLKLLVVYLLYISSWDKLIVYAILGFLVQFFIRSIYVRYCAKHFPESKFKHEFDKSLFKEMSSFAGWSFFGNFACVLYGQGINMLLNIFFGPVVNAARGVAVQVQTAVQQFAGSFQMAINPQITKNYANGNYSQMHSLMFRSARFSFYLLFLLILPVFFETRYILTLWLKNVPNNTVIFTQIMLCITLLNPFSSPCSIANQATGNVKRFQTVVGTLLMLILPVSYLVLKLGAPAYSVFIVHFCIEFIAIFTRMYMLRKMIHLPIADYFTNIFIKVAVVVIASVAVPVIVHTHMNDGFFRFVLVCIACLLSVSVAVWLFGLTSTERSFLFEKVLKLLHVK